MYNVVTKASKHSLIHFYPKSILRHDLVWVDIKKKITVSISLCCGEERSEREKERDRERETERERTEREREREREKEGGHADRHTDR